MLTHYKGRKVDSIHMVSRNEAWNLVENLGFAEYLKTKKKELKKKVTRELVATKPKRYTTK